MLWWWNFDDNLTLVEKDEFPFIFQPHPSDHPQTRLSQQEPTLALHSAGCEDIAGADAHLRLPVCDQLHPGRLCLRLPDIEGVS